MADNRIIKFAGYRICINDEVYEPAEDSQLLLEIIKINKGDKVLDMGCGTGILGLHAYSLGASTVYFVDINPYATIATMCTLKINGINNYEVINCDLLSCLRNFKFDVAIFNPPYLPFEEFNKWIGYSWSGGTSGAEVISRFLKEINANRVYVLYSSLTNEDKVLSSLTRFKIINKKERTFGFETLVALELIKND